MMSFDNSTKVDPIEAIAEGQVQFGQGFLAALAYLNCFINSSPVGLEH